MSVTLTVEYRVSDAGCIRVGEFFSNESVAEVFDLASDFFAVIASDFNEDVGGFLFAVLHQKSPGRT
jgi:hypothetical protein